MRETLKQPRILLAFAGVLALLATLALGAATIRPTEATWQDTVHGESVFGAANPYEGEHFARSISAYGALKQQDGTVRNLGPSQREAFPSTAWRAPTRVTDSWDGVGAGSAFSAIRAAADTRTCARRENRATGNCDPLTENNQATSYAVSELRNLYVRALVLVVPVPLITSSSTPIRATASCTPGANGVATLTSAPLNLGGFFGEGTPIEIPEPGESQALTPRDIGAYTYSGVIQHVWEVEPGYAKSQLRLHVQATGDLTKSEVWTFNAILAHAECGVSQSVTEPPVRPSADAPMVATSRIATNAMNSLRTVPEEAEAQSTQEATTAETADARADDGSKNTADLPTLDDAANDESPRKTDKNSAATATTSATASPTTSNPAETTAAATSTASEQESSESSTTAPETSEHASSESASPTEVATTETTEQTAVAEGPREPQSVRVGREFAVVNRDGVELGTAKVEDIVRTPGCGVELTLSITTSAEAGPDRWASVSPSDFAEVRPGGSIRKAAKLGSDCEQAANSTTTALSPGRDYQIVIAFQLGDSADRAMLRPDGTAGWIFNLPPLPRVTTTSPRAASPTEQSPATSTEIEPTTAVETSEA